MGAGAGWRAGVSCRGLSQSRGRGSAGVTAVSFLCRLCDCGGLGVAPWDSARRNCDHALVREKGLCSCDHIEDLG